MIASALFLAFTGCGESRATVKGTVTYKDKALPGGTVIFVTEDGSLNDRVEIQPDGSYSSTRVPIGKCRVGVIPASKGVSGKIPKGQTIKISGDGPKGVYEKTGIEYVDIPQALRDPDKSKITFIVVRGEQEFNIPLVAPN
jgi:hypothetical protein